MKYLLLLSLLTASSLSFASHNCGETIETDTSRINYKDISEGEFVLKINNEGLTSKENILELLQYLGSRKGFELKLSHVMGAPTEGQEKVAIMTLIFNSAALPSYIKDDSNQGRGMLSIGTLISSEEYRDNTLNKLSQINGISVSCAIESTEIITGDRPAGGAGNR